jgi:hypothetical protein
MTFAEILAQGLALLQREGRVSYRALNGVVIETTGRGNRAFVLVHFLGYF